MFTESHKMFFPKTLFEANVIFFYCGTESAPGFTMYYFGYQIH